MGRTKNEAALKLLRTGLRIDPARISPYADTQGAVRLDRRSLPLQVAALRAPAGFVAALALWSEGTDAAR